MTTVRSAGWIRAQADLIARASEPVLAHGRYILGPEVAVLEQRLSQEFDRKFAIGCNSGFGAHLLSLLALNIGDGSRVMISPFSPASFAGAVLRRNGTLRLADVTPGDFHLSPMAARKSMREVDAVVVHHLFGGAADMPEICRLADDRPVIEVVTYSFDARVAGGRRVGSYGTVATCCLREPTTLGAYGDAGMIWTDRPELADELREIRRETGPNEVYSGVVSGNFHMDTMHAAILLEKLASRKDELRSRQAIAAALADEISYSNADDIVVPEWYRDSPARFVILAKQRDELCAYLASHGIDAEPWWPVPIHLQPGFCHLGYAKGDFPNAEFLASRSLCLSPPADEAEAGRVARLITGYCR